MWVPLHLRSHYSLGRGTASVPELVERLRDDRRAAAALTDRANLHGQVRFHRVCREAGVRPVTGVELREPPREERGASGATVVLLARNRTGYENLCRAVTRRRLAASTPGMEAGVERLLENAAEGLFVLTDGPALARRMAEGGPVPREALRLLLVRPRPRRDEEAVRGAADDLGVRLVADPDPVFLRLSDHSFHVLRVAVHEGETVREVRARGSARSPDRYLPRPEEVRRRFDDVPEALSETRRVAEACRLDLTDGRLRPPAPDGLDAEAAARRLGGRVRARLRRARDEGRCRGEVYDRRSEKELRVIADRGLSGYFLAVATILEGAARRGIATAGRGSAVGSLVGHLLGLSPVDPVASGLHFERFVHRRRRDLPDVDLDVASPRREELIDWTHRRFGRERVAMACAIHRFRRRSAWREGLAALGMPPAEVDEAMGSLPPEELAAEIEEGRVRGRGRSSLRPSPGALRDIPPDGPVLIRRLVGRPRHVAVHPGGVVVAPRSLDRLVPLQPAPGDRVVTQYDADALEAVGLAKIDLLGSRTLAELGRAVGELGRTGELPELGATLRRRGPGAVPADDASTLELLDRGDTVGCGQIETPAVRSVLEQVPVRSLDDLTAVLAVVRPGAASGRAKKRFVRRARGEEAPDPPAPILEEALRETHGVLLYEEDIMRVLARTAALDLEEADELRREVADRQDDPAALRRLRDRFLRRAGEAEAAGSGAEAVWDEVEQFAAYSFNKAHAASYAVLAYQAAFFRRHAPAAFACGVLDHHGGSYPLRTVAAAVQRWDLDVAAPHVNRSDGPTRPEGGAAGRGRVRLGLGRIKGLTRRTGERILARREGSGPFTGLDDLRRRIRPSSPEVEALVLSGACDGLPPLEPALYPVAHEAVLRALRDNRPPPDPSGLASRVRDVLAGADPERVARYRDLVRVRNELRFLGMHPTVHPLRILRPEAAEAGCLPLREAADRPGERVRVAGLLAASRRVVISGGRVMRFLTLEDESGLLEAVLRPPVHESLEPRITTPGPYLVEGRVADDRGHRHLVVRRMRPFHRRPGGPADRAAAETGGAR